MVLKLGVPVLLVLLALVSPTQAATKRVLIWVANPNNQTTIDSMIVDLSSRRSSFNAVAYQYFAICGAGSDQPGGSNDCSPADSTGSAPHLAQGHPTGVPTDLGQQLRRGLGQDLELWPVISYGNPGNASVLNHLLTDSKAAAAFAAQAIKVAHAQNLTGFNFDLEADSSVPWVSNVGSFLNAFTTAMHAANPPIGVSYDGGNTPLGPAPVDRWVSMNTYTANLDDFRKGLSQGVTASGSKFGVGLCPSCQVLSEADVQARFDAIGKAGVVEELDMWAYGETGWDFFWPRLAEWLR